MEKEDIRKMMLACIGALSETPGKTKELVGDLIRKGEITVEQGKALTEELKNEMAVKLQEDAPPSQKGSAVPDIGAVISHIGDLSGDDIAALKKALEEREADKPDD